MEVKKPVKLRFAQFGPSLAIADFKKGLQKGYSFLSQLFGVLVEMLWLAG